MHPRHLCFSILLCVSVILSACTPSPEQAATQTAAAWTATPENTPTPTVETQDIVELVDKGSISFNITGGSLNELAMLVRNLGTDLLQMAVPAGTYFVNADASSQDMVVRHPFTTLIQPFGEVEVILEAACANLHLTEPSQGSTFTILSAPDRPGLARVIDQLNSVEVDYEIAQAAIWIVTDDATFDELGILVENSRFGPPIIDESEAVRAMRLVDQSGIDIHDKTIWGDRAKLIPKVTDPELSSWLVDQVATQAVYDATQMVLEATRAVEQATEAARSYPTPNEAEISQFATGATASSEYSNPEWSATRATGAPDTNACGDYSSAWASLHSGGKDWLLLTYEQPVIPTRIVIIQTYHPGAVSLVEVIDEAGNAIKVYEAAPAINAQCPYNLEIEVKDVEVKVNSIRVSVDQGNHDGWNEIDAVQLLGTK